MRKILLGTTAVVGAALMAPTMAAAQEAPTIRIGGYFRFNYNFTNQDYSNSTGRVIAPPGAGGQFNPSTPQSATTGKSDFSSDAEVHVIVSGKAANGLTYGATIELQVDANEGPGTFLNVPATNGGTIGPRGPGSSKTMVDTDEMYMFIAHPRFGQFRLGDDDGVLGGLMNSGHITNFGTGGVDGDWFDSVIRTARNFSIFPGDLGDNSKITYLSPQFFGFDFGASFAFNQGEGEDTGCTQDFATVDCDRAGRYSGSLARRRNEYQLAARWRGSFSGVGLSVTGGYIGADTTNNTLDGTTGLATGSGKPTSVWEVGAEATAFGLTVGGHYTAGSTGLVYLPLRRAGTGGIVDDRDAEQLFLGASYTLGAWTVGANYYNFLYAGSQNVPASRREWGWAVGATYTLAPGLQLVAEYVNLRRREQGVNFLGVGPATANNRAEADVVILGTRLAF